MEVVAAAVEGSKDFPSPLQVMDLISGRRRQSADYSG